MSVRRRRADQLIESFDTFYGCLPAAVRIADLDGRLIRVNEGFARMMGSSRRELEAKDYLSFTHPADMAVTVEAIEKLRSGAYDEWSFEKRRILPDGSEQSVRISLAPLYAPDGTISHTLGVVNDVSAQRAAERDIAGRDRILDGVAGIAADLVAAGATGLCEAELLAKLRVLLGVEGVAALRTGATPEALWDMAPGIEAPDAAAVRGALTFARGGLDAVPEGREPLLVIAPASASRDATAVAVFDRARRGWAAGEIDAVSAAASLVDAARRFQSTEAELREREDQLAEAQKLEAVGMLAAGVAHDFSNTLLVARAYAGGLSVHQDKTIRNTAGHMLEALDHAGALVRRLVAFSRSRTTQPRVIAANQAIEEATSLFERLVPDDVELHIEMGRDVPQIVIDPVHLEQVVMNLVLNAVEAMPAGGSLGVRTEAVADRETPLRFRLRVIDTGVGMAPDVAARAREAFFSTKQQDGHSGIGLATVDQIVRDAGGRLTIRSEAGCGTEIVVELPGADEASSSAPPIAPDADPKREAGRPASARLSRLLIVDDNEQLRTSLSRYLEQCGYSVFPARSAQAAIDAVEDDPEGFDILLTDIVMPGVSGIDLASGIRRRAPSISVVFMTGYTEAEVMSRGLLDADGAVFSKDMPVERLLGLLEGVDAAQESTAGDDPDASI